MIPYLHITIPTFGLMVATALLVSAYILQADFDRRRARLERLPGYKEQRDEGFLIIGVAAIRGPNGGRLYHAPVNPQPVFFPPPDLLLVRLLFPWVRGFCC